MAHFAEIKISDNTVLRVIVVSDEMVNKFGGNLSAGAEEAVARNISNDPSFEGEYPKTYWKQCSKQRLFRKNYPSVNFTYDSIKDIFINPKPFNSWTLDVNNDWQPPVVFPKQYIGLDPIADNVVIEAKWDEENQKWIATLEVLEGTDIDYIWNINNNEWEEA